MLTKLELSNFRRFERHEISLGSTTILVGPNNAGKSSIIEALRLIALVVRYGPQTNFTNAPLWVDGDHPSKGVVPSLRNRGFELRSAIYNLGEPPAGIVAHFSGGQRVEVLIGPGEEVIAFMYAADGRAVSTRPAARALQLPLIAIQPQVGPLTFEESALDPDYVRRMEGSARAPQHFRNQLVDATNEQFHRFATSAEAGWPGLQIQQRFVQDERCFLLVRDRGFTGEVSMMGHGLQMWLQTIWFLIRNSDSPTVILDEPDVYMHADLQRGLIRRLRGGRAQLIVATHSAEILSEVDPEEVVVVDSSQSQSLPASDLAAVQQVIDDMGGVHSLQLARLWRARRVLLVEGDDLRLLERFQSVLLPDAPPLGAAPSWDIGGWGGFNYAIGSAMALRNSADQEIRTFCLLDSDFHVEEEIQRRLAEAKARNVELHIWRRKEIENYLLHPDVIARVALHRDSGRGAPSSDEVAARLDEFALARAEDVEFAFLDAHSDLNRAGGNTRSRQASKYAKQRMADEYDTPHGRVARCPGKAVLKDLKTWLQQDYAISFSNTALAGAFKPAELDPELAEMIRRLTVAQ